jgi:hypothetical protein
VRLPSNPEKDSARSLSGICIKTLSNSDNITELTKKQAKHKKRLFRVIDKRSIMKNTMAKSIKESLTASTDARQVNMQVKTKKDVKNTKGRFVIKNYPD